MIGRRLSHYRIVDKLGEGGMGEVYLAEDTTLKRKVALKVLVPAMASDPRKLERFQREAEAVAALNHPHIVTIYTVEQSEGTRFLTMELVEGESLDQLLAPGGLPLARVFDIGVALADALAAAHEQGVVHRDLKPSNVMLSREGRVKVLDFGLAKLTAAEPEAPEQAEATQSATLTVAGTTVGTVPYMSPEQVQAEAVDHRTDIFSLGVMLYELATGRRPFAGKNSAELISSIMRDVPPAVTQLRENLPRDLGRIVAHCLQKDREQRFQSAKDVCNELRELRKKVESGVLGRPGDPGAPALESGSGAVPGTAATAASVASERSRSGLWIGVGAAVVVSLVAALAFWLGRGAEGPDSGTGSGEPTAPAAGMPWEQTPEVASIAVLPFADMSPEKDQEYFTDGLSEELLNVLARVPGLRVAARTSSFRFKDKTGDIGTIGGQLNVATVLEGSLRKAGDRLRITAQLINVADGYHLWSETYDRELDDIFAVQEEIARAVVQALKGKLLGEREPVPKPRGGNAEAFNLYLQGRYFADKYTREGLDRGIAYFEQALEVDPDYAPAWAGLARAYHGQVGLGDRPSAEGFGKAREAVQRALELDPDLPDAHKTLGWIKMVHDWDWAGAQASLQQALALDPGNARTISNNAVLAMTLGRLPEGIELCRRAVQLDPLSIGTRFNLGHGLWLAGRLDDAARTFEKVLELNPGDPSSHYHLGLIHLAREQPEAALEEMEREAEPVFRLAGLALGYQTLGRREQADEALAELIDQHGDGAADMIANVYAFHGETDEAFEWLERAYAQRDSGLAEMKVNPLLKSLHGDPRWVPFLRKMRLDR